MVGCCITSITSDNFRYIEADISLGYSLYLGWVSTVFFFICGSLLINAGQRYKKQVGIVCSLCLEELVHVKGYLKSGHKWGS